MKKVALSDNSGRWFDKDTVKVFEADYWYHPNGDPNSPVCLATGDEYSRETLYFTDQSTFVLQSECFPVGIDTYTEITPEKATQWLIANGHQQKLAQLELQPEESNLRC